MVAGCAERVRIADPARTWQVRIADGLSTVGDEELLRRAVDNLLINVLVHTPAGTAGAISACETGGQVIVEVSDDGPGVPPAYLAPADPQGSRGLRVTLSIPVDGRPADDLHPRTAGRELTASLA